MYALISKKYNSLPALPAMYLTLHITNYRLLDAERYTAIIKNRCHCDEQQERTASHRDQFRLTAGSKSQTLQGEKQNNSLLNHSGFWSQLFPVVKTVENKNIHTEMNGAKDTKTCGNISQPIFECRSSILVVCN